MEIPSSGSHNATTEKRMSQRQPLACRACTKSKVRCDKNVPCARCFRRNTPCERETVELSTKKRRRSTFIRGQSIDAKSSPSAVQFNPAEILTQSRCVPGMHNDKFALHPTAPSHPNPSAVEPPYGIETRDVNHSEVNFEDLATCIEGLAWGRHQCHKYPHSNCLRFEAQSINSMPNSLSESLLERLPDVGTARRLVNFHVRLLCWNHNVLHVPTFLEQCEKFWMSAYIKDGQWLALYCAVLSASAWSIHNSPTCQDKYGRLHTSHSPVVLFELVGEILKQEDFMGRHTVFSLQAICISGMVANILGRSDLLVTWVNASIRIAQCLGLHHIGVDAPSESWDEALEKEVGRRIWWKLVELDYHSIPYTGTYSINMRHFTTKPPRNCNDEDLQHQSEAHLTSSTYARIKARMAVLIPTLLDGPNLSDDIGSRYEHVIDIDRKMRQLVAGIPPAILRAGSGLHLSPEWLTLARRTLAIAAADKIIMIHRSFLLKSFQSPAYLFTRQTCISAAMTILREHEEISLAGPECPPIWVHSAFCVAAVVVICLDLLHCHASMTPQRKDQYVQLIRGARTRLSMSKNDTMARRGVCLVDAMLNEELYNTTDQISSDEDSTRQKFAQILHRFIQLDHYEPQASTSVAHPGPGDLVIGEQFDDFDVWFNNYFR